MGFDFDATEEFTVTDVGGSILKTGNYAVEIKGAKTSKSSGGHPQIELQFACEQGEVRDWLIYGNAFGQRKLVGLMKGAGLNPTADQKRAMAETGLVPDELAGALEGKKVGIQVREEPDFKDPSRLRSKVAAYATPAEALAADPPPAPEQPKAGRVDDWAGSTPVGAFPAADPVDDDSVPFLHDGFPSAEFAGYHHNR